MMADRSPTGLIIGAGTMGAGIAQVAAMGGWNVLLSDTESAIAVRAIAGIHRALDKLVDKGKLIPAEREAAASRLSVADREAEYSSVELVIEAIIEDFDTKVRALKQALASVSPLAIIATNTSSLSVTGLGMAIGRPQQTVGMHFFNPAPILPLVEIIAGRETDPAVARRAAEIARAWRKTVVRASDTPGFIVNRVARPFYLESWRMVEEGVASIDRIDRALRDLGGFRMGPFELTDMIGQDVNTASSRSVWEQLGRPARLAPCRLQESLAATGRLGRKSGRGAYDYATDPPTPTIDVPRTAPAVSAKLSDTIRAFVTRAISEHRASSDTEAYIVARVLVALINEAAWTCHDGVATDADIDTALKLATSYPRGPLEWAASIGLDHCRTLLLALNESVSDRRFAPSPHLG
jgi:3-hydroxybutyryl-CoA dehydrogenase